MSIAQKLSVMVLVTIGLMLGAFFLYFQLNAPLQKIEEDRQVLDDLYLEMLQLELAASRTLLHGFADSIPELEAAVARMGAAYQRVQELQILPQLNPEINELLNPIYELNTRFFENLGPRMVQQSLNLLELVGENVSSVEAIEVLEWAGFIGLTLNPPITNPPGIRYSLRFLQDNYQSLSAALERGREVTLQQFDVIDQVIERELSRVAQYTTLVMAVVVVLTMVSGVLMARRIAKPIGTIDNTVSVIAAGDLRPSFDVRQKDEIGRLGRNLNNFLVNLKGTIVQIINGSQENLKMEHALQATIEEASSSSLEIEANIQSISHQISRMDANVETALQAFDSMEGVIETTHGVIQNQNSKQIEAATTIQSVIASIETVSSLSSENVQAAQVLVSEADNAKVVFTKSQQKVADIADSVSSIQNLTRIISDISDRTNLLSMNAAIEAARAGEMGKGFGVVAGEIRKLAIASAQSSKDIEASIEDIVERIQEADSSRIETEGAFEAIQDQIQKVADSISQMSQLSSEAQSSSARVLSVMDSLHEGSEESVRQTDEMMKGVGDFRQLILSLQRVSTEVNSNASEISVGLHSMVEHFHKANAAASRVGDLGHELTQLAHYFTVEEKAAQ